jgi:hypothetical protein
MLEEVDRLTRLVESLLTLTRGESGRTQPALETVDLSGLAVSVVEHLRVLAEEKEQSVTVNAAAEVSATCDPAILRLGLINCSITRSNTRLAGRFASGCERALGEAASRSGPGLGISAARRGGSSSALPCRPRPFEEAGDGAAGDSAMGSQVNGGQIELE